MRSDLLLDKLRELLKGLARLDLTIAHLGACRVIVRSPSLFPVRLHRQVPSPFSLSELPFPFSLSDLIAASMYNKYSVGPSIRQICTRCSFTMTNMIQSCSNFHRARVFIINTRLGDIWPPTREATGIWPRSSPAAVERVEAGCPMAQASKAISGKSRESGCCGHRGGLVFKVHRRWYPSAQGSIRTF